MFIRVLGSRSVAMFILALASCSRSSGADTTTPEPAPASDPSPEAGFEQNTFVSTALNEDSDTEPNEDEGTKDETKSVDGFAVTTPEAAKEIAEAAVSEELDPQKSWTLSPVLPSTWPTKAPAVVVLFYPMAANPPSLTQYQLYTPAFRVTVSLVDATTKVKPISKRRKLGTIEYTRPSSLERRELVLAENALVKQLLGGELEVGARPYWGYLKYIHEHPKIGRDMERRVPKFIGWVRRKHGK